MLGHRIWGFISPSGQYGSCWSCLHHVWLGEGQELGFYSCLRCAGIPHYLTMQPQLFKALAPCACHTDRVSPNSIWKPEGQHGFPFPCFSPVWPVVRSAEEGAGCDGAGGFLAGLQASVRGLRKSRACLTCAASHQLQKPLASVLCKITRHRWRISEGF